MCIPQCGVVITEANARADPVLAAPSRISELGETMCHGQNDKRSPEMRRNVSSDFYCISGNENKHISHFAAVHWQIRWAAVARMCHFWKLAYSGRTLNIFAYDRKPTEVEVWGVRIKLPTRSRSCYKCQKSAAISIWIKYEPIRLLLRVQNRLKRSEGRLNFFGWRLNISLPFGVSCNPMWFLSSNKITTIISRKKATSR